MESPSFIDDLLQEETATARAKNTEKLGAEFQHALTRSVTQYLRESVSASVPEETVEREGIGRLDPQARKTIARRWLRHQPTQAQQLRTGEATVSGPSAHAAERAVIHIVDFVGITDTASLVKEQRRTAVAEWLGGILAEGKLAIEPENAQQHPIRIQEIDAVLHLVERNAFGQITSHEYPLEGNMVADAMQAAYTESSTRILQSDKETPSTTRSIGLLVSGSEIAKSIVATADANTVAIPLYLSKELANEYPGNYIAATTTEPQIRGGGKSNE